MLVVGAWCEDWSIPFLDWVRLMAVLEQVSQTHPGTSPQAKGLAQLPMVIGLTLPSPHQYQDHLLILLLTLSRLGRVW